MFGLPFLLIKERLEALPDLPQVMWYNAQYDAAQDESVFYVPATYIEFLPFQPQQAQERVQGADLAFRVHLMTELYNDDLDRNILAHFNLVDKIYGQLYGWEGRKSDLAEYAALAGTSDDQLVINQLKRVSVEPDHNQTNTIITVQEFVGFAVDVAAARQYENAAPVTINPTRP